MSSSSKPFNLQRYREFGGDVVIKIGDRSFYAHYLVIAEKIEYFSRIFADQNLASLQVIKLDPVHVDPEVFDEIIECAYTSNIVLTPTNLEPIYKAAKFLGYEQLQKDVLIFASNKVKTHPQHVVFFMNFARDYGLKSLEKDCIQALIQNPDSDFAKQHLLPALTFGHLEVLLKQWSCSNDQKLSLAFDWTSLEDDITRLERFAELADTFGLFESDDTPPVDVQAPPRPEPDVYMLWHGLERNPKYLSISRMNPFTKDWIFLPDLPKRRSYFACAAFNKRIYIAGGTAKNNPDSAPINKLSVFDTETEMWTSKSPMKHARRTCSMAELGGNFYVSGGANNSVSSMQTVERYLPEIDQWFTTPEMLDKRSDHELVQLNGCLYAIGGGSWPRYSERYDPRTECWSRAASPNNCYLYMSSAVYQGRIYISGFNSGEVYHPEVDRWTLLPQIRSLGLMTQLVVIGDKLYAFGGYRMVSLNNPRKAYVLDARCNTWSLVENMGAGRYFHRMVTVEK